MKHSDRIDGFVRTLHSWYRRHRRDLPWRDLSIADADERAYHVLVSEVMLQQTQVPRVTVKYKEFVQKFPSLLGLANASNTEILLAWRGLGYNSRALRLRDAAREIVHAGQGHFPREFHALQSIPGIGAYTAGAICNFAFDIPTALIDTNVRRVLHRTFIGPERSDGSFPTDDRKLLQICDQVLQHWIGLKHTSSDFFSALMDYGSLVQTKRSPAWDRCALSRAGIMKTTRGSFERSMALPSASKARKEPGRTIGGRFTPNRIVRGRIVEALRDSPKGMTLPLLGAHVAIDWNPREHAEWLQGIVEKLMRDKIVITKSAKIFLA